MANQNAQPFLPLSNPMPQDLGAQTYACDGRRITFTSQAGRMGMADGMFLTFRLAVTPTLGTGALAWSALRSFLTKIIISQGGKTYRESHPQYYVTRMLVERRLRLLNASQQGGGDVGISPFYAAKLGNTLPAITGAAPINFVFTIFIPFRWRRNLMAGMFPVGDSTRPLVIDLQTPSAVFGADPMNFPIVVSGNATATLTGTVEASLVYRDVLAYQPGTQVAGPAVGTQVRVTQQFVPITQVGSETQVQHLNQAPYAAIYSYVLDGNANPAAAAGVNGTGLTTLNVSRFRYTLTAQAPVIDLDTAIKQYTWLNAMRLQYGVDLPDGVFPLIFGEDDHGLGYWNTVDDDLLGQLPNLATWTNSLTGVTLASGSTINSAAAGLAGILSISEWLEDAGY